MQLIFERSRPGRRAGSLPTHENLPTPEIPEHLRRATPPRLPEVSEPELVRHFTALAGLVYLTWLGPQGLVELGESCLRLSAYAKERLDLPLAFPDRPTFKEFAVRVGRPAREVIAACRAEGVHPGYAIGRDYEGLDDALLVAVTERRTPAEIDRLAEVLTRCS